MGRILAVAGLIGLGFEALVAQLAPRPLTQLLPREKFEVVSIRPCKESDITFRRERRAGWWRTLPRLPRQPGGGMPDR
jgi:hypothetical protein